MGNKAGKRGSGNGGGRRRTSGAKGPKPPQGNAKRKRGKAARKYVLKRAGLANWVSPALLVAEVEIDRNAPCPCGSGAKQKRCCGCDLP